MVMQKWLKWRLSAKSDPQLKLQIVHEGAIITGGTFL